MLYQLRCHRGRILCTTGRATEYLVTLSFDQSWRSLSIVLHRQMVPWFWGHVCLGERGYRLAIFRRVYHLCCILRLPCQKTSLAICEFIIEK